MQINFVDINGAEASIDSNLSIPQILELRHEGVIWYAMYGDSLCLRAGLSYVQMERMRRAPIWKDHVEKFLTYNGLELSDANFKKYGCMPPMRKSQPQKGVRGISNRYTESGLERVRESSRKSATIEEPEQIREGSASETAPSISAVATSENPVEDNLSLTAPLTVKRTAFDPETDQAYEVELPSHEAIQTALLELDYPAHGMSTNSIVNQLAEHFSLTELQTNARGSAKSMRYKLFPNLVNIVANNLVKSRQLVKPRRGWFDKPEQIREGSASETAPSNSAVAASHNPVEDNLSLTAEKSVEANYQQLQGELAADLLLHIKDNSPAFFEELVIDLLVAMGYGGSREDAEAVGRSGDGGIDGIINEDILGLDVIYVQAKRWEGNVSRPEIQKFAGALQGQRARKGIFITTSDFTREARNYVTTIDYKIVLIDGYQLAQFMIDHNVGVSVVKSYEIKRVDSDYFAEEG